MDVIGVVPVRYGDVSAVRAVLVGVSLVGGVRGLVAVVDVVVVDPVQVPVVRVVGVVAVRHGDMAAAFPVHVLVADVRVVIDGGGHEDSSLTLAAAGRGDADRDRRCTARVRAGA
jgi:hypothetical protein